jgi:DNA invertase Pin-like site-specific DNA recombinase
VEKPKKVGLYLRVSTAGQTVENQRAELVRVAEQRGWQIVETYIDRGVSGAKGRDKRPEFDRLCRDAAQAKIDVVAAWSIDRIGRSLHHVANFMAELADQGVALYLHQQGVDGTTSAGKAMLGMAAVFAEFERALIVERIRSVIARVRGKKRLGRPPVHANIEHRIRELRRTGYGKLRIARTLGCGVSTVQRVLAA